MAITYKVKHYSEKLNETDFLRYLFQSKTNIIFHGDEMKPLDIVLDEMLSEIMDKIDEINSSQSAQTVSAAQFTIPTTAWVASTTHAGLGYQADVPINGLTAGHVASTAFDVPSVAVASTAGVSSGGETREGVLRLFSAAVPASAVVGECLYALIPSPNAAQFSVPTTAWVASTVHSGFGYHADIPVSGVTANHTAVVAFNVSSVGAANTAGVSSSSQTREGELRLFAVAVPNAAINGECLFVLK